MGYFLFNFCSSLLWKLCRFAVTKTKEFNVKDQKKRVSITMFILTIWWLLVIDVSGNDGDDVVVFLAVVVVLFVIVAKLRETRLVLKWTQYKKILNTIFFYFYILHTYIFFQLEICVKFNFVPNWIQVLSIKGINAHTYT